MTTPLSYFLDTDAPFKHDFVRFVKDTNFLNMTEKQRADFWGTDVCTFAFSMFSKSMEWHQKQKPVEIISQTSHTVGNVGVSFTVGRVKP